MVIRWGSWHSFAASWSAIWNHNKEGDWTVSIKAPTPEIYPTDRLALYSVSDRNYEKTTEKTQIARAVILLTLTSSSCLIFGEPSHVLGLF